jgi:anti-anti-sigma regulatory factor
MLDFTPTQHPEARVVRVNMNTTDPVHTARALRQQEMAPYRPVYILIDCQGLQCLRTHGVGYFISQLLLVRKAGVAVMLHNVSPLLDRLLRLLQLHTVFDATRPAALSHVAQLRPAA